MSRDSDPTVVLMIDDDGESVEVLMVFNKGGLVTHLVIGGLRLKLKRAYHPEDLPQTVDEIGSIVDANDIIAVGFAGESRVLSNLRTVGKKSRRFDDTEFWWDPIGEALKGNMGTIITREILVADAFFDETTNDKTIMERYIYGNLLIGWIMPDNEPAFVSYVDSNEILYLNSRILKQRTKKGKKMTRKRLEREADAFQKGRTRKRRKKKLQQWRQRK